MIDRYTKAVLTIIAVCLVWNVGKDMLGVRQASAQYGDSGPVHVIVDRVQPFAFQFAGPMRVAVDR